MDEDQPPIRYGVSALDWVNNEIKKHELKLEELRQEKAKIVKSLNYYKLRNNE